MARTDQQNTTPDTSNDIQRRMRLLCFLGVSVFAPCTAHAANTSETAGFFGMHLGTSRSMAGEEIQWPVQMQAMGKPVVTDWMYLERERGEYTWDALDRAVAYAKEHNVPIFVSHEGTPLWATSDRTSCQKAAISGIYRCRAAPKDENTETTCEGPLAGVRTTDCMWKEFVTSLVQRYRGKIQMYEGWNEPSQWAGMMSVPDFVKFERDFLETVRANDSSAQVCSPAFVIDAPHPSYAKFMNEFFANGGPRTYDCYDFHINAPLPEEQLSLVNQFKAILAAYGLPNGKPIYATESGRWSDNCTPYPAQDLPQAYIGRIELLYSSWGIARHYWYAYDSCGTLSNPNNTLNAAGIAYGNIEKWMIGATVTACGPETAGSSVWTCRLTRPGGYEGVAIWNTAGQSTYTVPSQYKHWRSLYGDVTDVAPNNKVLLGELPLLLENQVSNPTASGNPASNQTAPPPD